MDRESLSEARKALAMLVMTGKASGKTLWQLGVLADLEEIKLKQKKDAKKI